MPDESEQAPPLKKQLLIGLGIVLPVLLIVFLIGRENRAILDRDPAFVTGTVTELYEGAKGERYVHFSYRVGDSTYIGRSSLMYCRGCVVGDKVRVRYATEYPATSELAP